MPSVKQASIASAICLVGFLGLTAAVAWSVVTTWDWAVFRAVAWWRAGLFVAAPQLWWTIEWLSGAISHVGSAPAVLVATGLVALWLRQRGSGVWALAPLAWLPLAALEVVLKLTVGQPLVGRALHGIPFALPRPEPIDYAAAADPLGAFPSGHALRTAYLATFGFAVLWRRGRVGRATATACVVVALLFGLSRLYLRWHWPSDVLAGWLLGVAAALPLAVGLCGQMRCARRAEGVQ